MTSLSTHVLDTARGRPAAGVPLTLLARDDDGSWRQVATATTGADGRARVAETVRPGRHRLEFGTGDHLGPGAFYPVVTVEFVADPAEGHYHLPLLLSPYGYSTYRGS